MNRYLNTIIILAAAGIALSAILLYQHYHPDMDMGIIACGRGFVNPCISVGQSKYAVILGVPVAALGLIYYIFIAFMLLVADYTKEKYYAVICGLILPVAIAGVAADIVLGSLMMKIGSICSLCAATYAINVAIAVLLFFMIKKYLTWNEITTSVKNIFVPENSDQKAVLALTVLFVFFMAFSVISGAGILRLKSGMNRVPEKAIVKELVAFYNSPVSTIEFPQSSMTAGSSNPEIKIYVFTDFLCIACYKFYNTEKYILAKYGDKVQFVYYHYPLDSTCNRDSDETLYAGSCTASRSMYAAAKAGFFEEYFFTHFGSYKEIKEDYGDRSEQYARQIADKASGEFNIGKTKIEAFNRLFDSPALPQEITDNIELAVRLKVGGTPTVYIDGREFNGVPSREILEAIILRELSESKN